jgi:hypothetical protein
MQVESNQLVLKTDCGIFVDRQRNCCAAASAAGGEHRKDKGVAILDYALGNRPSTGGGRWAAGCAPNAPGASWFPSWRQSGVIPPYSRPPTTRHEKSPGRSG